MTRLRTSDTLPHEISLVLENVNGIAGTAWFDDVELVSPSGQVVPVIGQFDNTPMDDDTAWFNRAYGELFGARSPVGARKPLVRGETGVDSPSLQDWNRDLPKDTAGVWLHNNIWGQVNSGGMYDLMWRATETISLTAYTYYLTCRSFMEGIPLNNGQYRDAGAQASNPNLRVWGQRDDFHGRAHLLAQNTQHTWKRVVFGPSISPMTGTITLNGMPSGVDRVTWWNIYSATNPIFLTQTIPSAVGTPTLTLPAPLADDVGIKVEDQSLQFWSALLSFGSR